MAVLALVFASCDRPAAAEDSTPTPPAVSAAAGPPAEPAATPPTVDPARPRDGCRDWSDLDLGALPPLPEGKHVAVLDEVWKRVVQKHYDVTLGCLDWPALRETYAEKVAQASDAREAYRLINEMLGELGQSHFRLWPPGGGLADEEAGSAAPPMEVRWVENQLVVVRSTAGGPQGRVLPGSTVVAIGDDRVDALVEQVRARVEDDASSTFAFEVARVATAKLSCARAGQTKTLRLRGPDDREIVRVVQCEIPEGEPVTLGNLANIPTRVESRVIEGTTVGYLAFNIWMLPMVKRVSEQVASMRASGITALIIDLRGNPGGVGPMSVPVARLLLAESASLGKLQFRDFTQAFNVEANPDAFRGPVALLVDEGTASTSEIFAAGLRDLGRAQIFGSRASAGAALPSVIEELAGGAVLQYVVGDYHSPKGTMVEGKGVTPDVVVPETRADFAAGRDPVLEAAVQALQKEGRSP